MLSLSSAIFIGSFFFAFNSAIFFEISSKVFSKLGLKFISFSLFESNDAILLSINPRAISAALGGISLSLKSSLSLLKYSLTVLYKILLFI